MKPANLRQLQLPGVATAPNRAEIKAIVAQRLEYFTLRQQARAARRKAQNLSKARRR